MPDMLQAALDYLDLGLAPLPCHEKRPLVPWAVYQQKLPTVQEVTSWWTTWPDANIALVLPPGALVVDLDGPNAGSLLVEAGIELPANAPSATTGKGSHIYLTSAGREVQNKVALFKKEGSQVDIRAAGGYVLAPPSRHPNGKIYEWTVSLWSEKPPPAPAALIDLLAQGPGQKVIIASQTPSWVTDGLKGVHQGERDDMATRLAGYLLGKELPQEIVLALLEPFAAACTPPLAMRDLQRVVRSIAARDLRNSKREHDLMIQHISDVVARVLKEAEDPVKRPGITSHFASLNKFTPGGFVPGDLVYLGARPGVGKAQPLTSKILLADGRWTEMGQLELGDELASPDGQPSIVEGIFPQGVLDVFRIELTDGRFTLASADHLWKVWSSKWHGASRIVDTAELGRLLGRVRYHHRLHIASIEGHFGVRTDLPIAPYLLGAFIGNGCSSSRNTPQFSTADQDTLARVGLLSGATMRHAGGYDYRFTYSRPGGRPPENRLRVALREVGLLGKKSHERFIPERYFEQPLEQRRALLQGLMDTDGWSQGPSAFYATSSEQLSRDVVRLVQSLGATATVVRHRSHYTYLGRRLAGRDSFRITIQHSDLRSFFQCERKKPQAPQRLQALTIKSISPAGQATCRCIKVSHSSSLYITDGFIPTHNTALALDYARSAARHGKNTVFVSREMLVTALCRRLLAQEGHLDATRLKMGMLPSSALHPVAHQLSTMPIWLTDSAHSCQDVRRIAGGLGVKIDFLIVDYLQLMQPSRYIAERRHQVEAVSQELKDLATSLEIPVLCLSSLSRPSNQTPNAPPDLSRLRESGELEHDADVIIFLHRPTQQQGEVDAIVAKNREGAIGTARLRFKPEWVSFFDDLEVSQSDEDS